VKKGTVELVSVALGGGNADSASYAPRVTDNGRFVVFSSLATNLVAGDDNGAEDVFVRDRSTGVTERVSLNDAGGEVPDGGFAPSISADGRWIVFQSISRWYAEDDGNGRYDVFLRDRLLGTTVLLSRDLDGNPGNGNSGAGSVSANGRYVVFQSRAANMVAGDGNNSDDIFLYDVGARTLRCLSLVPNGSATGSAGSISPSISPTGKFVVFATGNSNLVPGDSNGTGDVILRGLKKGVSEIVSRDSAGGQVSGTFDYPVVSSNGKLVMFESDAAQLVPGDFNGVTDVFAWSRK
jgi:Tol biopolymer transport system component